MGGEEDTWKWSGDSEAQYNLANMYFSGTGVKKDLNEALKWYKIIAERNADYLEITHKSKYKLGYMHFFGIGTDKNYTEAAKWLKEAAEDGDTDAIKLLNQNKHIFGDLF